MRCTVDFDSRVWARNLPGILQCVPSLGFVPAFCEHNCATRSSLIGAKGARAQLIMQIRTHPAAGIGRRHLPTVALVSPQLACDLLVRLARKPLSKNNLGPAHQFPQEEIAELARLSRCSRCCTLKKQRRLRSSQCHRHPHFVRRCLYSQQYYCHLFMDNTLVQESIFEVPHVCGICKDAKSVTVPL